MGREVGFYFFFLVFPSETSFSFLGSCHFRGLDLKQEIYLLDSFSTIKKDMKQINIVCCMLRGRGEEGQFHDIRWFFKLDGCKLLH